MDIKFRRLVASVARWIIANEDNGANQSPAQRNLVQQIRELEGEASRHGRGSRWTRSHVSTEKTRA